MGMNQNCCNCESWNGPIISHIDHSHCLDIRNDSKTLSKGGDRKYDTCLYFQKKENQNVKRRNRKIIT